MARDGGHHVLVTLHPAPPIGPEPRELLRRIDVLRQLGHATLVLPSACGELDGCAWVVELESELPDVRDRMAMAPFTLATAVAAIRDLTRAVAAMHRREITHGAIDLDAIRIDGDAVRLGGVGLSLGATRRDDLDALGLVAWGLLSGERRPTAGRRLSQLRRGVSPELDALAASLVAPNPADRPQRAEAILDALDAVPTPRRGPLASIVDPMGHDARPRARGALGWAVACVAIALLAILLATRA